MIFWINTPFDTLPGEEGRPMRYWLLARALRAAGHEVVMWGSDFHHVKKERRSSKVLECGSSEVGSKDFNTEAQRYRDTGDEIEVRLVPTVAYKRNVGLMRLWSHARYARRWERMARRAVERGELARPDCIVVSMPPLELYGAAARLRRKWRCRVVVDVQDLWPENFYRLLSPRSYFNTEAGRGSFNTETQRRRDREEGGEECLNVLIPLRGASRSEGLSGEGRRQAMDDGGLGGSGSTPTEGGRRGSRPSRGEGSLTRRGRQAWLVRLVFWPWRRMARRAYEGADGVSAVAKRYLRVAERSSKVLKCGSSEVRGESEGRMGWFPLGVDISTQRHRDRETQREGEGLRVCYVGNLGAQYDLRTLVKAVGRLKGVVLVVAGDGPGRGIIEEEIKKGEAIEYRGYLGEEEMMECMRGCDVGVVPMFSESGVAVPNKVIDYAAAGLAIVNGLKGESAELVERYQAGVNYEVGEVESLVAALESCIENREKVKEWGRNARKMAEEEFDAGRIYEGMVRWLERLLLP